MASLLLCLALTSSAQASTSKYPISYSGRLVDELGAPLTGSVALTVQFYRQADDAAPLLAEPLPFSADLNFGVFQIEIALSESDINNLFGNPSEQVWIEVSKRDSDGQYRPLPRQRFNYVPYALQARRAEAVPVDGTTLGFDATSGKLKLLTTAWGSPGAGKYLTTDGSGSLLWSTPSGSGDMLASTYDSNGDGKVNSAVNADQLGGQLASYYTNASNLATGTIAFALLPTGAGADKVVASNDARLSDPRTPSGAAGGDLSGEYPNPTLKSSASVDADRPVASDHIKDGSVTNAKLAGGIAPAKIATDASNRFVSDTEKTAWSGKQAAITSSSDIALNNLTANAQVVLNNDAANFGVSLKAKDDLAASYTLTLPADDGNTGEVLQTNGSGVLSWIAVPSAPITTVAGRTGTITLTADDVASTTSKLWLSNTDKSKLDGITAGANMLTSTYDSNADGKVNSADAADNATQLGGQSASYYRDASNLNAGTVAFARLPVGTAANTVAAGDDARLTNARTPTGAAGGDLSGTYPNPTLKTSASVDADRPVSTNTIKDGAITTAKLAADAVDSSKIANSSIVDADIADGAITDAKLATISTSGKVSGAAITSGTISGTSGFAGSGGVTLNNAGADTAELRFSATNNTNYVGFKAPATIASNKVWTLPSADGSSGQVLSTGGNGTLSWMAIPSAPVSSVAGKTGIITLTADDVTATASKLWLSNTDKSKLDGIAAGADMLKSTYDSNANSKIDLAEDAEKLGGQSASYYTNAANLATGTVAYVRLPIGTAANTIAAGDDARFSDPRTPTGSAGGDLTGSYPNPTLKSSASDDTARAVSTDHIKDGAITNDKLAGSIAPSKITTDASNRFVSDTEKSAWTGKQAAITGTSDIALNNLTANGQLVLNNDAANFGVSLKAKDDLAASYALTLPADDGNNGEVLQTNGSGVLSWTAMPSAPVTTVAGRTGTITLTADDVTATASKLWLSNTDKSKLDGITAGANMLTSTYDSNADGKVNSADAADNATQLGGQAASYYRDASNLNAGTVAYARLPVGTAINTVAAGDDARLTNARTPTGAAGGDLSGTYPNPTLKSSASVDADRAVGSDHIKTGAITTAKLAADAVDSSKILNGTIGTDDLANSAITTAKIAADAVDSSKIANGTIGDADIASNAAIVDSKLATISTAGKVSGSAITSGSLGGTSGFAGTGGVYLQSAGTSGSDLRFFSNNNTNYLGFRAPNGVTTNTTWTLPAGDGGTGHVLSTGGNGTLSWIGIPSAPVSSVAGKTGVVALNADDVAATASKLWLSNTDKSKLDGITAGANMLTSTYDSNADGKVNSSDTADNATQLGGQTASYYRDASNLNAGTVAYARLPVGTAINTVAAGDDLRLTNARTPTGAAGGDLAGTYPNPTLKTSASVDADRPVGTNTIKDSAITSAKLAADAVDSSKILNATITAADIADGTITDAKLAGITTAGKVSGAAITTGTIVGNAAFNGSGGVNTTGLITTTNNLIVNGGNVGIGTSSPTQRLGVNGTISITGAGESITTSTSATSDGSSGMQVGYDSVNNKGFIRSVSWGTAYRPLYFQASEFRLTTAVGSVNERMVIQGNGYIGIGTTSPSSLLSVGTNSEFQINSTGNLTKVNNVSYSWPSAQGGASTVLTNNGSGTLSWASAGGNPGLTSCPAGFTMVGTSGKRGTFCIDSDERTAQAWLAAKDTCRNLSLTEGRAFMCSHNEWYTACQDAPSGLTNMTNNWEWVAEFYSTNSAILAGSGGCSALYNYNLTFAFGFRCCVR